MLIIIVIIVTTKTNGVSFSLVAGACCFIAFTHAGGKSQYFPSNSTVNINSTGAKYISAVMYYYSEGTRQRTLNSDAVTSISIPCPYDIARCIWVYDGTRYVPINAYNTMNDRYDDYSD